MQVRNHRCRVSFNRILLALALFAVCRPAVIGSQQGRPPTLPQMRVYAAGSVPLHDWTIGKYPLLMISGHGSTELVDLIDVARLANGDVAVASVGTNDIRFFSRTGRHIRTVGREGRGPAEFTALTALFRMRDTIVAANGSGIAHVFTDKGVYVRTEARPEIPTGEATTRVGYTADGRVLLRTNPPRASSLPNRAATQQFKLWMQVAGKTTLLGSFPANELVPSPSGKPRWPVFGPRGFFAVLRSGFCAGYSARYIITCYNLQGEVTAQFERRGLVAQAVTQSHKNLYFYDDSLANPTPQHASGRAYVKQVTQFAPRFGLIGVMTASTNDELWIGPVNPGDATVRGNASPTIEAPWSVYSSAGQWLSDVALPARFRVMEVGSDFVAGVRLDAEGIEHVVVYSLQK